jgi:hypothetical protein
LHKTKFGHFETLAASHVARSNASFSPLNGHKGSALSTQQEALFEDSFSGMR